MNVMAGQPDGIIVSVGQYKSPETNPDAFSPSPIMKNATANVQVYYHLYFKSVFNIGPVMRQRESAMWTQRIRDEFGREWMLFCYDYVQDGVAYIRFVLDCLAYGKIEKLDQLKNTKVTFKLVQAHNMNELRSDEQLANDELQDGNSKITILHNFTRERRVDSGSLLRREEIPGKFLGNQVILMVTVACKIGEDVVEFDEAGGVKKISKNEWPY